jgi:hypothetical protein
VSRDCIVLFLITELLYIVGCCELTISEGEHDGKDIGGKVINETDGITLGV